MNEEGRTELLAALARVIEVFDALGVDYLVGGSIASSIYGEPRQTLDADLPVRMFTRQADALDRAYLVEWANQLAVTNLLRRALPDAGLESLEA